MINAKHGACPLRSYQSTIWTLIEAEADKHNGKIVNLTFDDVGAHQISQVPYAAAVNLVSSRKAAVVPSATSCLFCPADNRTSANAGTTCSPNLNGAAAAWLKH
jgi:hypothetical protein